MQTGTRPGFVIGRVSWTLRASCLFALLVVAGAAQAVSLEDEAQAVLVYKTLRFVTWPELQQAHQSFDLCVLGSDSVAVAFETLRGRAFRKQLIDVFRLPEPAAQMRNCHLVFISPAALRLLRETLVTLQARPVLTVGITPGFARSGGMIGVVSLNSRTVVEVNTAALRAAGIGLNSQLLQLATIVRSDDEQK